MTETTTSTPTPTEDDYTAGYADGIPPELAPYYPHGPISEAELVAAHSEAARDWLYRRELRPLRDEQAAWAEIDRSRHMDAATRHERMRETMPRTLASIRERESIFDVAARLADRPLDNSERREYVHGLRLAEARRAHKDAEAAEQQRRRHEQNTTCQVCGAHQPTSVRSGVSTLVRVEAAGRSARACTGCALLVPVVRAERAAAELVDGATRRQRVESWLDGR